MPDELSSQIPWIKRIVEAFSVASLEKEGFEADDIIATIVRVVHGARRLSGEDPIHVSVVTGDKDMYQLVDDNTDIFDYAKDRFIGEAQVRAKFGVAPANVADLLGLAGDSSDNIPGVAGIGVKTAAKLIEAHGTIEEMLENIAQVAPERVKKKLEAHRADAELSKRLATLDAEVPLDFKIEDFLNVEPDFESLSEILRELEFVKLIKELIPVKPVEAFVEAVRDEAALERLAAAVRKAGQMALSALPPADFDGKGETGHFELDGIGVAAGEGEVFFLPLAGGDGGLPGSFSAIIEDADIKKFSPDLKPLYKYLEMQGAVQSKTGCRLRGAVMDISIASYLLNPGAGSHNIDDIAGRETPGGLGSGEAPEPFELAGARARAALRLAPTFEKRLAEQQLTALFREMELPLVEVLASMESAGISVSAT